MTTLRTAAEEQRSRGCQHDLGRWRFREAFRRAQASMVLLPAGEDLNLDVQRAVAADVGEGGGPGEEAGHRRTLFADRNMVCISLQNQHSNRKADGVTMNAAQCRMARAALQIGVRDLAAKAKVSPSTIARLEAGEELRERTVDDVRAALESSGVEFIAENGGGPGVRLRKGSSGS